MITEGLIDVARRYWAAEESRNIEQILSFFHPDAIWKGPGVELHGRSQIARYYEASGEEYPELSVDIVGWHCSRDEGAIQWRALFKDRSGAPAALEGINIMCVEDGLITTLEAFFDPAQLARPLLMSDASETTHHKGPK